MDEETDVTKEAAQGTQSTNSCTYRQASYSPWDHKESGMTELLSVHIPTDPSLKGCETDLQMFIYHRIDYVSQNFY